MKAINKAIHEVASNHPGGARALAKELNLQPGTFSNKCNPAMDTHVLNLREFIDLSLHTEKHDILHEVARKLHCVCVPIERYTGVGDMDLLDAWSDWDIERAETIKEIRLALDHGEATREQFDRIQKEMFEDFQKELALLERLRTLLTDEQPETT